MRAIDYFDKGAEAFADRTAIIDGDTRCTYRELKLASERIARAMSAARVEPEVQIELQIGDRAAIYSPNDARVLFCVLGLLRAGAVWVPINSRNASDANIEYMNYVETSWLFYHSSFRDSVREIKQRVPSLRHCICIDAECDGDPSLESFMTHGSDGLLTDSANPYGNPDDLMGIVPTGGTTGPAKGVMVTNVAWGTMVELAGHYWRCDGVDPVCLSTAPLSHAAGTVAFAMFPLGATNVVLPKFDALEVLTSIERYRVTHIFLPPTAFYSLTRPSGSPQIRLFKSARFPNRRRTRISRQIEARRRSLWSLHVPKLRTDRSADADDVARPENCRGGRCGRSSRAAAKLRQGERCSSPRRNG